MSEQFHERFDEAMAAAQLGLAKIDEKFMSVVWTYDEATGIIEMHRTTFRFPTGRFKEAIELLQQNLNEVSVPKVEPLPRAYPRAMFAEPIEEAIQHENPS